MIAEVDGIPPSWGRATIGDRCAVTSGATPKTGVPGNWGGGIPWITPDDLSKNRAKVVTGGARTLTPEGFGSCSTTMVPAGTVLFSSRAPIGYVAVAGVDLCTNQGFKSATPDETLTSDFLYWQLQHATPDIKSRASGTTFLEISKKGFADTAIVVPPLAEQERIVEILEEHLSRLDAALDSIRTIREKADQLRRSVLQSALGGGLPERGRGARESPAEWPQVVLSDVVDSVRVTARIEPDAQYELWSVPSFNDGKPERVLGSSIGSGKLSVRPGDVLISKINPRINRVWLVAEPTAAADQIASTEWLVARCPNGSRITPSFLRWVATGPEFRDAIQAGVQGVTGSHTRAKTPQVMAIRVPVPAIDEQDRIVRYVESQLSLLDVAAAACSAAEVRAPQLRRSLLHAAFTGRLTEDWREQHRG